MKTVTFKDLIEQCNSKNKSIWEIAIEEESSIFELTEKEIRAKTLEHINVMKDTIKSGLISNEKSMSGWCGDECEKLIKRYDTNKSPFGILFQKIMIYALATSEENLRMGRIVACPTAGSCGIIPSVLIAYAEEYNIDDEQLVNALLTAGKIGSIISNKVQLAGAVAGCQAECGVASAMAAGALVQLMGGTVKQIINATALSLKNVLGLTCDSVCGIVEVPCVKRNPMLAVHAICAVEMALANIKSHIPLDEVVDALANTGRLMSPLLKESAQGGLAITKTAMLLKSKLFK